MFTRLEVGIDIKVTLGCLHQVPHWEDCGEDWEGGPDRCEQYSLCPLVVELPHAVKYLPGVWMEEISEFRLQVLGVEILPDRLFISSPGEILGQ